MSVIHFGKAGYRTACGRVPYACTENTRAVTCYRCMETLKFTMAVKNYTYEQARKHHASR